MDARGVGDAADSRGRQSVNRMPHLFICDSQVHAPVVASTGRVGGIDEMPLLAQMAEVGVDRAVLVPLPTLLNPADNEPSRRLAERHPDKFAVMGLVDLARVTASGGRFDGWPVKPEMLGIRVSFYREPMRSLFIERKLDWVWAEAEIRRIPVMILASGLIDRVDEIARNHPDLRLVIDHMGVDPFTAHSEAELLAVLEPVNALARYPNVAVKVSCAPAAVAEQYPFPSLHEPLRRLIGTFSPRRSFWGSDLTRLPCTYRECATLFTSELDFLTGEDLEWVMGRALCEWLDWPI